MHTSSLPQYTTDVSFVPGDGLFLIFSRHALLLGPLEMKPQIGRNVYRSPTNCIRPSDVSISPEQYDYGQIGQFTDQLP